MKKTKGLAKRNDGKVVKLKKPMSDKKGDMMVNRPFKEEDEKKPDKPDRRPDRTRLSVANRKGNRND